MYVTEGDSVTVRDQSTGTLTFRGGSVTVLCAGSESDVGPLWSDGARSTSPNGELSVSSGRVLADTASTSAAFDALALTVRSGGRTIENDGKAWYAVAPGSTEVSSGSVEVDGAVQAPTMSPLDCGDGQRVEPPGGTPSDTPAPPSDEPTPGLLPTPSTSPIPSPTPEPTAPGGPQVPPGAGGDDDDDDGNPNPGTTTGRPPTTRPPTTRPPTTRPPASPTPSPTPSPEPPPNEAPTITWELQPQGPVDQQFSEGTCNGQSASTRFIVVVGDDKDAAGGPVRELQLERLRLWRWRDLGRRVARRHRRTGGIPGPVQRRGSHQRHRDRHRLREAVQIGQRGRRGHAVPTCHRLRSKSALLVLS